MLNLSLLGHHIVIIHDRHREGETLSWGECKKEVLENSLHWYRRRRKFIHSYYKTSSRVKRRRLDSKFTTGRIIWFAIWFAISFPRSLIENHLRIPNYSLHKISTDDDWKFFFLQYFIMYSVSLWGKKWI